MLTAGTESGGERRRRTTLAEGATAGATPTLPLRTAQLRTQEAPLAGAFSARCQYPLFATAAFFSLITSNQAP